jgi:O-antigen/teichoic acid export membrane protein
MNESHAKKLTSGHLLVRNTVYSFIIQILPIFVAVLSIPLLIKTLGTDRFGILTLAWMVISYFSLFDLGLGRALTQLVSEKIGSGDDQDLPVLIWTASLLMFGLGLLGTLCLALISPWLVYNVLKVPKSIQLETLNSFYLLSASIPIVTSTAGFAGILSAWQRFDLLSFVRIPMGLFTFVGPLLVLPFSRNLLAVVTVLVIGRMIAWTIHILLCIRVMPTLRHEVKFEKKLLVPLLRFGGWMTVSNILDPIMLSMDRFFVGAFVSVTAVSYYSTAYEVANKLLLIPSAVLNVLFPAFATSYQDSKEHTRILFFRGVKYIYICMFPLTLIVVSGADIIFKLWLGEDFAINSSPILRLLTIGIFIDSLAYTPWAFLQGIKRPDLPAKINMVELPFYIMVFWWLTHTYGLFGAAISWTLRIVVNTVLYFYASQGILKISTDEIRKSLLTFGASIIILIIGTLPMSLVMKALFLFVTIFGFLCYVWFILDKDERIKILEILSLVKQ